jgi:hypothetical protein
MAQTRVCAACGQEFPATAHHFKRTKAGGLTENCLECRRKKNRGQKIIKKERTLDDLEQGATGAFLKAAASGGENIPHVSEVLERVMGYFGGSNGFAAMLMKQYFDSPPGSATRTRMLESILKLTVSVSESGAAKKPLELWTDEELEGELDKRIRGIAANYGRVIDAQAPETWGFSTAAPAIAVESIGEGADQGDPGGAVEPVDRGDQDVPADPDPGRDAQVQGE